MKWVESCLVNTDNVRDDKWTDSVAVGSERFSQNMKSDNKRFHRGPLIPLGL